MEIPNSKEEYQNDEMSSISNNENENNLVDFDNYLVEDSAEDLDAYYEIEDDILRGNSEVIENKNEELENSSEKDLPSIAFREYQHEIYRNSLDKNGIVYLETGSGKTVISMMLINYYLSKFELKKKIIFLANTILLVEQQYKAIKEKLAEVRNLLRQSKETPLPWNDDYIVDIDFFHGQKEVEDFKNSTWISKLNNIHVMVLTPQIMLNGLRRGQINLSDFILIIFDECHHAHKDHPYRSIMEEFYFRLKLKGKPVPYIYGLTASPIIQNLKMDTQIYDKMRDNFLELAKNLDSMYVRYNTKLYDEHRKRSLSTNLVYKWVGEFEDQTLKLCVNNFDNKGKSLSIEMLKEKYQPIGEFYHQIEKINETYKNEFKIDPKICTNFERIFTQGLIILLNQLGISSVCKFLGDFADSDIFSEILDKKEKNKNEMSYFTEISKEIKIHKNKVDSFYKNNDSPSIYYSNKFDTVYNKISENLREPKRFAVIFVERRFVAKYLCDLIKEKAKMDKRDWIKPQFLIGFQRHKAIAEKTTSFLDIENIETLLNYDQRKSIVDKMIRGLDYNFTPSSKNNSLEELYRKDEENDQNNIIKQIKENKINLIVCTSVAEEGFDVPECDMVISFDPVRTLRNYIQHIGRARKKESLYHIMTSESNISEMEDELVKLEESLKLIPDVINKIEEKDYNFNYTKRKEYFEYKLVAGSEAMINTNWSVSLISNFCSSLSKDNTYRTKPLYYFASIKELGHLCYIVLPISKGKERIFPGEWKERKEDARRSAALKAVITLKKENVLTADLRPSNQEQGDFGDQDEEEDNNQYPLEPEIAKAIISIQREIDIKSAGKDVVKKKVTEKYYPANLRAIFSLETPFAKSSWYLYHLEVLEIDEVFKGMKSECDFAMLHFEDLEKDRLEWNFKYEEQKGVLYLKMKKVSGPFPLSEQQYTKLRDVHQFLFCTSNRLDLALYALKTEFSLSPLSFYKEFISRPKKSSKFLEPIGFLDSSYYTLLTLTKKDKLEIDWEKIEEVIKYMEEMKKIYEFLNKMEKMDLKNKEERLKLEDSFVLEYRNYPFRYNKDIILQNILDFNKVLVVNHGKVGDFNLELVRKSKKKTYKDHKHELQKFFYNRVSDEDYILKYEGASTFLNRLVGNNLMKRGDKKVETKSQIPEEELVQIQQEQFSERAGFTLEFKRFPLFSRTSAVFNVLQLFFLHQIRDFLRARNFRLNTLRQLELKTKKECQLDFENKIQGYKYEIPENMVFSNADKINFYMQSNKKFCEEARISPENLAFIQNQKKLIPLQNVQDKHKKLDECFKTIINLTISDKIKDESIKTAITSKGYSQENNYEYLEYYGDTILKMLATIQVFFEYPNAEEGTLHVERNKIINNNFLKSRAVNSGFFMYIIQKLIAFYPNGFIEKIRGSTPKGEDKAEEGVARSEKELGYEFQYIPKKVLADVIESLIGLHYDAAKQVKEVDPLQLVHFFLYSLGILKYPLMKLTITDKNLGFDGSPFTQKFEKLEKLIGYSFNRKNLLLQAFTHQDFENIVVRTVIDDSIDYEVARMDQELDFEKLSEIMKNKEQWNRIKAYDFCYERLEFLGDSVLDFLVNERIRKKKTDKAPGKLSLMKQACVNNRSLSIIAMHYDFEHFVLLKNPHSLRRIVELKKQSAHFIENPNIIPNEFSEPLIKALGDIFEAFVGALFLDNGLDINLTRDILSKMIMEKFIDKFMLDDFVDKQPEAKAQNYLMTRKLMKDPPKIIKMSDEEWELKYAEFKWVFKNPKTGDTLREIYAKTEEEAKAKFYREFD